MTIDLQPFCSYDRHRTWLSAPFAEGEYTYATNGHAAVRIPGRHTEAAADLKAPIAKLFEAADSAEFLPFDPVDAPKIKYERCDDCGGAGHVIDCDVCEAKGEHTCEDDRCGCSHDCGACDGKGATPARAKDEGAHPCDVCSGRGHKRDGRRVSFGDGLALGWEYVRLVQALPGPIEWSVPTPTPDDFDPKRKNYGPVAFRGDGWTAIIMTARSFGEEAIIAHRLSEVAA